jgi:hypothetical protein
MEKRIYINKVEGFNPEECIKTCDANGIEVEILPTKAKEMWFFSKYPEGAIRKGLVGKSDTSAIFECRLYANRNDEKDNFIANGFAERIIRPGDSIGEKFLECGETAATSRALDAAGFTFLGCNSDMDEVIEPLPYEENKPSEKKQEKPKKTTKKKEKNIIEAPEPKQDIVKNIEKTISVEDGYALNLPEGVTPDVKPANISNVMPEPVNTDSDIDVNEESDDFNITPENNKGEENVDNENNKEKAVEESTEDSVAEKTEENEAVSEPEPEVPSQAEENDENKEESVTDSDDEYKKALLIPFPFGGGALKGKTIGDIVKDAASDNEKIAKNAITALTWTVNSYRGEDKEVVKACKIVLNKIKNA